MDFNPDDPVLASVKDAAFTIGNDVVFLNAFKQSWNVHFRDKVYTEQEISYCEQFEDPLLRYASTWAAKEAVYKAIKQLDKTATGFRSIEILREKPAGRPNVSVRNREHQFHISLSISHDGDYVWAIAIAKNQER